jgi:hypothetical protein
MVTLRSLFSLLYTMKTRNGPPKVAEIILLLSAVTGCFRYDRLRIQRQHFCHCRGPPDSRRFRDSEEPPVYTGRKTGCPPEDNIVNGMET